jgi:predicted nucleotidyltransferase
MNPLFYRFVIEKQIHTISHSARTEMNEAKGFNTAVILPLIITAFSIDTMNPVLVKYTS